MASNLTTKGNTALDNLLTTVQPYSNDDWKTAYTSIGFEGGESAASANIQKNCISAELLTIAQSNSWYLTHHYEDTYIFNGEFWVKLEKGQVVNFVKNASIKMGIPKYKAGDVKFGKDLYEQILHSGIFINDIKSSDELLLNMKNGTLSITNDVISMRAFDRKDFLTYQLGFDYDSSIVNQDWLDFLEEILPEEDSRKTLQQALGSLILRGLKIEKVIFLYGTGSNGKSVVFEVLKGILGAESFSNYSLNSLTDEKGYHRADIKDKIINFAPDIDLSKVNTGMFKTLASGEPVECRPIYKQPFIMENYAKLIFNLNDISDAKIEDTHGFFRRMLFIPFDVTIPSNKQDKKLPQKLLINKAGIFNWLLDGAREVMKNEEIFESQESKDFLLKFRKEPNSFERFILTHNIQRHDENEVSSSELHHAYSEMCIDKGDKPLSQILFSKQMIHRGFSKHRTSEGIQWAISHSQ